MERDGLTRETDKMKLIIFISLAVLLSFSVNALSVASDFLENDTLLLMEGTSKLYGIRLQNPSSGQVYLQITSDNQIAKIVDYEETYVIPAKSSRSVLFNVSALNLKPGNSYSVGYTVYQLSGSGSGVGLALKINKNFNVKIIENPDKPDVDKSPISGDINYRNAAYIAIILLILIYSIRKIIGKNAFKHRKIIKRRH